MNSTKDNWIKAFDEKFPYNGCIFEDDGRSYNFDDIKSFISQVEKDAIEKTNKRWRERVERKIRKQHQIEPTKDYKTLIIDWNRYYEDIGYNQALYDLLEEKK